MVSTDENLTLLTDLYQLTMAQGYWASGKLDEQAVFHAFFRSNPFGGGYAVACGTDQLENLVRNFHYTDSDMEYLSSLRCEDGSAMFNLDFLLWLSQLKLSVDIDAVEDGTIVFAHEPLVRVTGPLVQCQLLETALLNGINFQTLIATKASRVVRSAAGKPVSEFGLRRAQGPDGGLSASRASFVGGVSSVANVLAGKKFDIPVNGTHAHSWVMSFESEQDSFRAYAQSNPNNCSLLVDTYNVVSGIEAAINVGTEMKRQGKRLSAVRIDSGDLAWLSKKARHMLNEAGMRNVKIIASNDLDEYTIMALKEQGACVDAYGVGTRLATAYDQAALGGVYKLAAIRKNEQESWKPCLKVSEEASKITIPGILDVCRFVSDDGTFAGDCIYDVRRKLDKITVAVDPIDPTRRKQYSLDMQHEKLLKPFARDGKICGDVSTDAHAARAHFEEQYAMLDDSIKRFKNPHRYPAGIERMLFNERIRMILHLRGLDSLY